ncbi:hypothetical protein FISHEDRAFT_59159 [Fistulina hepatica ATCC 64428]|uniref:Uncharacterized protein n=1 Tax=Fistulina hepatica ATCC 64428 TaxID=1128425 RepID=A0A0D7AAS8_9AGAR|nr:hypothetical protein FISHEDRAFT_59159 [Fistulina hepatica ATCC 64428]
MRDRQGFNEDIKKEELWLLIKINWCHELICLNRALAPYLWYREDALNVVNDGLVSALPTQDPLITDNNNLPHGVLFIVELVKILQVWPGAPEGIRTLANSHDEQTWQLDDLHLARRQSFFQEFTHVLTIPSCWLARPTSMLAHTSVVLPGSQVIGMLDSDIPASDLSAEDMSASSSGQAALSSTFLKRKIYYEEDKAIDKSIDKDKGREVKTMPFVDPYTLDYDCNKDDFSDEDPYAPSSDDERHPGHAQKKARKRKGVAEYQENECCYQANMEALHAAGCTKAEIYHINDAKRQH